MLHLHSSSHRRHMAKLSASRTISVAGGEAAFVALAALLWQRTHDAGWLGSVILAAVVTHVLVAPLAGWLGDHVDRRRLIACAELASALCWVAIATLHSPWSLLVAMVASAICTSPIGGAINASVPSLVPEAELVRANAMLGASRTAGQLVGPVAGGLLVSSVGPSAAFAVNAASFAFSAMLVASIRAPFGRATDEQKAATAGITAGYRALRGDRVLRSLVLGWSIVCLAFGTMTVAELPLAHAFGAGNLGFGLLISAWGAGSIVGSLAARRMLERMRATPLLAALVGLLTCAVAAIALAPDFAMCVAAMGIGGLAMSIAGTVDTTIVQQRSPEALRSRIASASESIVLVSFALALAAGGWLVNTVGAQHAYGVAAACAALGACNFAALAWRLREGGAGAVVAVEGARAPAS